MYNYERDWSVVSKLRVDEAKHILDVLPGDTKLDAKRRPLGNLAM